MTKPDPNQLAVQNAVNQAYNLPAFVRSQIASMRAQLAMIANNEAQKAILGGDAATIEAALAELETAAGAFETKLAPAN